MTRYDSRQVSDPRRGNDNRSRVDAPRRSSAGAARCVTRLPPHPPSRANSAFLEFFSPLSRFRTIVRRDESYGGHREDAIIGRVEN